MIAFKYTKENGAEYLSHLDLLRHIYRTLRRAGIPVKMSEGFHAHPRIFLNNPLPVGVCSQAEYGAIDTDFTGDFLTLFNGFAPSGVRCLSFKTVPGNPNYASGIVRCEYVAEGVCAFDADEILNEKSIVITDLRGRETDIRPRIYSLERCGDGLTKFVLGCGENNLRPDLFADYLCSRFGGNARRIVKLASFGEGVF